MKALPSVFLAIAIVVLLAALVSAPLWKRYDDAECREAYARARTRADTSRIDLHPYGRGGDIRGSRRCGEVRATRPDSGASVTGLAQSR